MPNQYSKGIVRCADRVADYIEMHPGALCRDIAQEMGMSKPRVSQELWTLRQEGRVEGKAVKGGKALAWSIVGGDIERHAEQPRRIHRSQWQGHQRDDWHKLFFGAAA